MLSDKDRELIGIGASIAAGCEPCAKFHLRAARIAGASEVEIGRAVNDALSVRDHATEAMAQVAAEYADARILDAESGPQSMLLHELVSVSAAHALNSVGGLEMHVAAARKLGATEGQIRSAIKIASAIKATASGQLDRHEVAPGLQAAQTTAEERSANGDCHPRCGCQA